MDLIHGDDDWCRDTCASHCHIDDNWSTGMNTIFCEKNNSYMIRNKPSFNKKSRLNLLIKMNRNSQWQRKKKRDSHIWESKSLILKRKRKKKCVFSCTLAMRGEGKNHKI